MDGMSEALRTELASIDPRRVCDRLAELSGLFHSAGALHLRGRGEVSLTLDLGSPAAARRAFSLLRDFGVPSEIRTYTGHSFERATRYELVVAGEPRTLQVMHEAGVVTSRLGPLERPPKRVVGRSCCRGAYLRGALLGRGSLSGPSRPHLELRTATVAGAELLAEVAAAEGVELRIQERPRHAVAYAKGADAIADLLACAGASDPVLALKERAVMGAARAEANRLANADHANLVRAGRAAHAHIQAIHRLEETGELSRLPAKLQELAELRLRHPTLSLRELGLKCRPPVRKATAQGRLRRLKDLAADR